MAGMLPYFLSRRFSNLWGTQGGIVGQEHACWSMAGTPALGEGDSGTNYSIIHANSFENRSTTLRYQLGILEASVYTINAQSLPRMYLI